MRSLNYELLIELDTKTTNVYYVGKTKISKTLTILNEQLR